MDCERAAEMVDAYLDSELDPVHAVELEGHLKGCARCAGMLERGKVLQKALRAGLPRYVAPAALRREVERAVRPQRRWVGQMGYAIAASLLIAAGVMGLVVFGRGSAMGRERVIAEMVVADHLRSLQADHLMDVKSTSHHTVKPWFAGKLAFTPPVRELDGKEFKLEGGRLDMVGEEQVAALVYSHGAHVINLFVWPVAAGENDAAGKFESITMGSGYHVVGWVSGEGMRCFAVSDMEEGEMMRFAEEIENGK